MRIPPHYTKTFQGPPHGVVMEREYLNKYGRPLLGATIKPKLGLSARNYGRVVYEALRGGLDFTKDDENINTQPFMRWRDRYLFTHGGGQPGRRPQTGEVKGHYLNVTAATMEDMYERAEFAKELGSVIIMIDLTVGYTAMQSMSKLGPAQRGILHLHRAGHGTYTRQKNHGVSFRVIAEVVRLIGVDHIHAGTVVGKLEGDPTMIRGYYDTLRLATVPPDPGQGIYFEQDWASMPGVMPVASGGIHAGQMHQLLALPGRGRGAAVRRRHHRPPDGHRGGRHRQPDRGRGHDQGPQRGPGLPGRGPTRSWPKAAQGLPPLQTALEIWGDITFNFESTDIPDVVATPTSLTGRRHMRITQGTFSYLPDLTDDEITAQIQYAWTRLGGLGGVHRRPAPPQRPTGTCGGCRCSISTTRPRSCTRSTPAGTPIRTTTCG